MSSETIYHLIDSNEYDALMFDAMISIMTDDEQKKLCTYILQEELLNYCFVVSELCLIKKII